MGNNLALNLSNQMIKSSISSSNEAYCKCSSKTDANQSQNISGNDGADINATNNWSQAVKVDSKCIADVNNSNALKEKMEAKAKAKAKAAKQFLSPGNNASANINNLVEQLSQAVHNSVTQKCSNSLTSSQQQNITDNKNSKINVVNNWTQKMDAVYNCTLKDDTVTKIRNNIASELEQSATSKAEGVASIGGFVVIVVLIIAAVVIFFLIEGPPPMPAGMGNAAGMMGGGAGGPPGSDGSAPPGGGGMGGMLNNIDINSLMGGGGSGGGMDISKLMGAIE